MLTLDSFSTLQKRGRKALRGPRYLEALRLGSSIPDEAPGGAPARKHSWGSQLMPWEIGWNGQQWLEEHLSMQDVREGFRCARSCPAASQQLPRSGFPAASLTAARMSGRRPGFCRDRASADCRLFITWESCLISPTM